MSKQPSHCASEGRRISILLLRPAHLQLPLILLAASLATLEPQAANRLQAGEQPKTLAANAAESRPDDDGLSPAVIADRIEQSMRQFDSVEYTVEYTETRDLAPWGSKEKPIWVDGEGRLTYRSDGMRWFLDEHANTFNSGDRYLTPERRISGFDGRKNFHFNSGRSVLVLGEDDHGRTRSHLPNVLWRCGNHAQNLLWALRNPDAKIVNKEMVGGRTCLVIELKWVPEWDQSKSPQRLQVTISPEQSYLPLKAVWERNGKVTSESQMVGLKQTPEGPWYPLMIRTNRGLKEPPSFPWPLTERIKALALRGITADNQFSDEELQYVPPFGIDIVDRRLGVAWHNDPWWLELAPWIKEKFDWPRSDTSDLIQIESYCDKAMTGEAAPRIEAAEWLNSGNPGAWDRKDRFISVIYFFGGGAIDPHPKWAAALRTWQAKYRDDGVELIGVATNAPPAGIKQAVEQLALTFPIAIDQVSDRRGSYGKTFDAFKMQAYMGVVIVDPQGKVRLLESQRGETNPQDPLDAVVLPLFEAAGRKPKFAGDKPVQPQRFADMNVRLPDASYRAIAAEWKRRAALQRGSAQIHGSVSLAAGLPEKGQPEKDGAVEAAVRVLVTPQLWLMNSNNPSSHFYDTDVPRTANVECDADGDYRIGNLRKGTYTLTFSRPGFATSERKIVLPSDDSEITVDVLLPSDTIGGKIVDEDGQPVAKAKVRAVNRHLTPPRRVPSTTAKLPEDPVLTGAGGEFLFESLFAGAYTFEISADGYEKASAEIVILGTRGLKVVLKRAAAK